MSFADELEKVLPADLPNRDRVIAKSAEHLERILEANRSFNLTRIISPREAAIKHVLDSVLPWRHFSEAQTILDAGTGAGFPGIPLAIVLPDIQFLLSESVQKKTRFVEAVVLHLGLSNVEVSSGRAEEILRDRRVNLITARAVAPLTRAIELFGPAIKRGSRALFYKGPDPATEITGAQKPPFKLRIVERYELPDHLGARTIVDVSS